MDIDECPCPDCGDPQGSGDDDDDRPRGDYESSSDTDDTDPDETRSPPPLTYSDRSALRSAVEPGPRLCPLCQTAIAAVSRSAVMCTAECLAILHGRCSLAYTRRYGQQCPICRRACRFITVVEAAFQRLVIGEGEVAISRASRRTDVSRINSRTLIHIET